MKKVILRTIVTNTSGRSRAFEWLRSPQYPTGTWISKDKSVTLPFDPVSKCSEILRKQFNTEYAAGFVSIVYQTNMPVVPLDDNGQIVCPENPGIFTNIKLLEVPSVKEEDLPTTEEVVKAVVSEEPVEPVKETATAAVVKKDELPKNVDTAVFADDGGIKPMSLEERAPKSTPFFEEDVVPTPLVKVDVSADKWKDVEPVTEISVPKEELAEEIKPKQSKKKNKIVRR